MHYDPGMICLKSVLDKGEPVQPENTKWIINGIYYIIAVEIR